MCGLNLFALEAEIHRWGGLKRLAQPMPHRQIARRGGVLASGQRLDELASLECPPESFIAPRPEPTSLCRGSTTQ